MTEHPLHILCFGAGAIGAYIGGSLALVGHRVTFIEQPAQAEELRQHGLSLRLADGVHHLIPQVAASVEEALTDQPYDAAIFALKSFDTQAALTSLLPYRNLLPPILCLQNGVDNEPTLSTALGQEKVIAGTVTSAVGRAAVGQIVLERHRGIGIAADHPTSPALAHACQQAGLNVRLYANSADMKWSKLLTNLMANATSAILGMPPADILNSRGLFELELQQMCEALRVMKAQGLHVVNLPGTPVRALAFIMRYLPASIAQPLLSRSIAGGRGAKMPSFYIDLHGGRKKTEVDYLNGAIVRHGALLGIATPVNRFLTDILQKLASDSLPLETYLHQPDKLLAGFTSLASSVVK